MIFFYLHSFDYLNNVFVAKHMFLSDFLGIVLDAGAPNESAFEFLDEGAVNFVTEIFNSQMVSGQNHGGFVVGQLSFGLCVSVV